jgi:transcriptional regulator with XRE-family HTH domain
MLYLVRENIRVLLAARNESQTTLAQYCGHDKSWLNKFLNEGRGIQIEDLDRIAAFFGIEPYQLFQPGISRLTERRRGVDRRTGTERRIGHTGRLVRHLQSEVNKLPRLARRADYDVDALPPEVRAIIEQADRDIAAVEAQITRRQAAGNRRALPPGSESGRGRRGPDPDAPA